MDAELGVVKSHLRLVEMALEERGKRLEKTRERLSRHYNKVAHTATMLVLVKELQVMIRADPDLWEPEFEEVPF